MAFWHHPRFSSGEHGSNASVAPLWDALAAARAEVVLTGHDHSYERFAPQTSAGVPDPGGIRQFVVGTGGKNLRSFPSVKANSEVRANSAYGVLTMDLHPDSFDWQFLPEPGRDFSDSGSQVCR